MSIDELTGRVTGHVEAYRRTGDPEAILDEQADRDAAALWRTVRGFDPDTASEALDARYTAASTALGRLCYWRHRARPGERGRGDLARALLCLEAVSDDAPLVPSDLRPVIGRFTDPRAQEELALALTPWAAARPHREDPDGAAPGPAAPDPAALDAAVLEASILLMTHAAAAAPRRSTVRGARLAHLCLVHRRRHEQGGSEADLELAVTAGEESVAIAAEAAAGPAGEPAAAEAEAWIRLAAAYECRHRLHGDIADLRRAVDLRERALARTGPRPLLLSELAALHRQSYERTGAAPHAERAAVLAEEAAALSGGGTDPAVLSGLSTVLLRQYERSGTRSDLWRAAELALRAVETGSADHPERGAHLADAAAVLLRRHERSRSVADLDRAVMFGEQALAALPDEDPRRRAALGALAAALHRRYAGAGAEADLDRAATLAGWALAATPPGHPDRSRAAMELAAVHLTRFLRSGVLADVARAVELGEQALADPAAPPAPWLSLLGEVHRQRHRASGAVADLDRAVGLGEQAVAATTADDVMLAERQARLAAAFWRRHGATAHRSDLDRAVELGRLAVAGSPDDHVDLPDRLSVLAAAHLDRHRLDAAPAAPDAEPPGRAPASAAPHAVRAAPGSPPVASGLSPVSPVASTSGQVPLPANPYAPPAAEASPSAAPGPQPAHSVTGSADLGPSPSGPVAVASGQASASADLYAPPAPPGQPSVRSGPVTAGQASASADAAPPPVGRVAATAGEAPAEADLDAAVALGERALALAPEGHPGRSRWVAGLCAAHLARIGAGGCAPDPARLRALAREVTGARTAAPADRLAAHHAAGVLAHAAGRHRLAVALLDAATALLPSVAPREAGWADQQLRLGAHDGLVTAAVAAHCAAGDPAGAVETAELGRGVLLASQAGTRADLAELARRDPRLADRFRWTCERLNTPDFPSEERRRWWAEYDALLAGIRARPGLSGFLAPPRMADLRAAAAGGCAVLVNAGPNRGDAVLVRPDGAPVAVPLPGLRPADVADRVAELLAAVDGGGSLAGRLRRRRVLPEVLGWLWDSVVAPVAEALDAAGHGPHRVWWVPTGLIGLLPLHAAGHPGRPGALDTLVSSYAPSLRALREARERPPAGSRRNLTVALHHTPELPDLPGAAREAGLLEGPVLVDGQATADGVLAALRQATWAHFACHGVVDPVSQADSGLRVHDRLLRLSEIGALRLAEAELAYLSACSTANHGLGSPDEVLHLASAFQAAGFRHVVASLWPLADTVAVEASRAFHHELSGAAVATPAARVLRRVTLRLRTEHPDRPDLWAPLVHSGP
ncbi:CHAT domain-containing protein [Streptomyces sp. V4-01]|uniref:CHAT domain-containing protein n=1 Tax=Actinacidiphila polyblastidii TaxID=3110430 RepID=A0ABU7P4J6_9ACTN|nr:CHAT domain-containing protein [Streptomyces sp. V4-01]